MRFFKSKGKRFFSLFNLLTMILLVGLWKVPISFAHYHDSEPLPIEEILEQAKISRVDFIRVVSDMQRLAPVLVWPETLYSYLLGLKNLEKIGHSHGMESWGSSPVRALGYALTEHAIKWLHFERDSAEVVTAFLQWAKDDVIHLVISAHQQLLLNVAGKEELIRWYMRISEVLKQIAIKPVPPYVLASCQHLQGAILVKLLQGGEKIEDDIILKIIDGLDSQAAIEMVSHYLFNAAFAASRHDELDKLLAQTLALAGVLQKHHKGLPTHLLELPGDIALDILRKSIYKKIIPDAVLCLKFVSYFSPKQIGSFVNLFNDYKWELLTVQQARVLLDFGKQLLVSLQNAELLEQTIVLKRLLNHFSLIVKLNGEAIEGVYQLRVGKQLAILTLLHLGDHKMVAALRITHKGRLRNYHHDYIFSDVSYDLDRNVFTLKRMYIEDPRHSIPSQRMYFMEFKLLDAFKNKANVARESIAMPAILGIFSKANHIEKVSGVRKASYYAFTSNQRIDVSDYCGKFTNQKFTLTINAANGQIAGILTVAPFHTKIFLNYGVFDDQKQMIYLTSGEQTSDRLVQLRGQFIDQNHLQLTYIIGGSGTFVESMVLTRQP